MRGRQGLLWAGTAAALILTACLLVRYGSANVHRVLSTDMGWHPDFETFHRSAAALLDGRAVYGTGAKLANLNPPVWTVLLAPFGYLAPLSAYRLFALLTVLLMLAAVLVVARELRLPRLPAALASAAVLLSSPVLGTVALGQVYVLLVVGLMAAWVADRRGRPVLSGVLLGLVVAIKPTLAPVLLLPVVQRRWPMAWAALAGTVAATLLGVLVAGAGATVQWLRVLGAENLSTYVDNASLPSLVARFGAPAWPGFLLGALVVGATLWRARQHSDLALWALTAVSLLLSPVAWHNYLLLCFPGVYVLLHRGRTAQAAFLLAWPLVGVEWAFLWTGNSPVDRLASSLYCFVLVAYWLALRPDPAAAAPRRGPEPERGISCPAPPR